MFESQSGRTFLEIPATLICPDCHSNFMAVGTLKKPKNFTTWESDEFIQTIKSGYPECINPFHVFFLSVDDFDPKLVEKLPDAFQQSHKGLIKHRDDQTERARIMTKFLEDMRTNFIFPLIEKKHRQFKLLLRQGINYFKQKMMIVSELPRKIG